VIDIDALRAIDPDGARRFQLFAQISLEELENYSMSRIERLMDSGVLSLAELWEVRKMCRAWAVLWSEGHFDPDEREHYRRVVQSHDRQTERLQAKAAERLRKMGYNMEQG